MNKPELLAPAGGRESLEAAVRCGADAVYLGMDGFNARKNAQNFDAAALADAVRYCHQRGVQVYLTLNTLVFDQELPQLSKALESACEAGVDALLVQDLAVAALARSCAPTLALHASTQMSIHNADGAKLLEQEGFSRVVLAREMSLEEIRAVHEATGVSLECFVHGALCMCISGQCALSSVIGGRSGNRGLCAQPCRLPFHTQEGGEGDHALSLRDLSLLDHIPELSQAGVSCLKIEGRMKRPEYVAAATTACRKVLDGEEPDRAALEAVFSRSGFTDGYLTGKRDASMFGTRQREDVVAAAPVLGELAKLYHKEQPRVPLEMELTVKAGQPVTLQVRDDLGHFITARGDPPQEARTAPTTRERAEAALSKTGGTPYHLARLEVHLEENLMVPASALNALRRLALEELDAIRGALTPHPFAPRKDLVKISPRQHHNRPYLRLRLHNRTQLTDKIIGEAAQLVLPLEEAAALSTQDLAPIRDRLLVELPPFYYNNQDKLIELLHTVKNKGLGDALVGSLGALHLAKTRGFRLHGDTGLNLTNTLALGEAKRLGLRDATLSFELELSKIRAMGGTLPRGILAYGHLPLMRMRSCPVRGAKGCRDCSFPTLTDRKGNRFFLDCRWDVSTMYNHLPLFLADRLEELNNLDFLTLYFTRETPWECDDIFGFYQTGRDMIQSRTRGLYYRKVL